MGICQENGARVANLSEGFDNACTKAKISDFTIHNVRHTYASQMLSTGVVPLDWIADQMGHTSTAMIWKHYGKWINEDGPDMIGLLEGVLKL